MIICTFTFAQDTEKLTKLRLAQGFEEEGEWERAAALYEDLSKLEPNNFLFLDGLQRSYTGIKEYSKAINVIRRWLILQPRDVNKMTTLGGLYYESGNVTGADSAWKAVIAIDPHNLQIYRVVANEMMEHRLLDQCIRTYQDGRLMSKNDAAFADELGNLYSALQQYASATKEYIRLIKTTPQQLSFIQSRLSVFTVKPEGISAASETVKDELKNSAGQYRDCIDYMRGCYQKNDGMRKHWRNIASSISSLKQTEMNFSILPNDYIRNERTKLQRRHLKK